MDCSTLGFPVLHYPLEFAQTYVHCVNDAIQPSHSLLPSSHPALSLSQHQGFFPSESVLHIKWSKYWSFSLSISPSNEYSGHISFRIAWFVLLAVQGTLKSLLQHHSLKASILQHLICLQCRRNLGWEDPLGKRKATHSSILAWRIP